MSKLSGTGRVMYIIFLLLGFVCIKLNRRKEKQKKNHSQVKILWKKKTKNQIAEWKARQDTAAKLSWRWAELSLPVNYPCDLWSHFYHDDGSYAWAQQSPTRTSSYFFDPGGTNQRIRANWSKGPSPFEMNWTYGQARHVARPIWSMERCLF